MHNLKENLFKYLSPNGNVYIFHNTFILKMDLESCFDLFSDKIARSAFKKIVEARKINRRNLSEMLKVDYQEMTKSCRQLKRYGLIDEVGDWKQPHTEYYVTSEGLNFSRALQQLECQIKR